MKVSRASALALVLRAAAARSQARDVGVTDILTSVLVGMKELDAQVLAYKGGPPLALRDAAIKLYEALQSGTESAQSLDFICPEEAKAIGPLATQVSEAGESFLRHLGCAQWAFESAGICDYLYQYTVHLGSVTNKFFSGVGDKFPEKLQAEAQKKILAVNVLFEQAEAQLAPGVCVNKVEAPSFPSEGEPPAEPVTSSSWYTTGYHNPGPTHAPEHGDKGNGTHQAPAKPVHRGDAARVSGFVGSVAAAAAAVAAVFIL